MGNQNELIKVQKSENGNSVSARELHTFIESETQFTIWIDRMLEYGFTENVDFILIKKDYNKKVSKNNPIDYALTLDTAKEIAMLQRTEKGKQARQYFIECEKQLLAPKKELSKVELAQMLLESAMDLERAERANAKLEHENKQLAPKAMYFDKVMDSESGHTTTIIAKEMGMSANHLNDILREMKVQYKTTGGDWVLTSKYQSMGLHQSRTHVYLSSDKFTTKSKIYFVWTEVGRKFVHEQVQAYLNKIDIKKLQNA